MRSRNTPTRTITRTVISLSLAGVVLGLTLTAILPAAYGQVINACVKPKTGALHILTSGTCKAGESPISWGITGLKGDKGDPGTPGTNGTPGTPGDVFAFTCPPDSVLSGRTCIDTYEASVWQTTDEVSIAEIRAGTVTLAELQGNGVQLGLASGDLAARGCLDTGQDVAPFRVNSCKNVYAVSIPGVKPSAFLTWFQATAAARNAGKRLPTNAEWQAAALGTPDTGGADDGGSTCNTDFLGSMTTLTGSRSACVSDVGAFDMVGNLWEWVADWVPRSTDCPGWGGFSDDSMCLAGAGTAGGPGALVCGGSFTVGGFGDVTPAGVFAVVGSFAPSGSGGYIGFRAAR